MVHVAPSRPTRIERGMKQRLAVVPVCMLLLSGCFSSNPDSLKEHTADATAAAKRGAGQIAKGIFEGLTRKGPLDLNTASPQQLAKLPGITPALATAILAGRPYADPPDLVKRHILTRPQFNRIKAQITVTTKTP